MGKAKQLYWREDQYDKFLLIENHDLRGGFAAIVIFVLNGIRRAKALNAIPIVDFNCKNTADFYDEKFGNAVWEYFFESVSPYTPEQVKAWVKSGELAPKQVLTMSKKEFGFAHHHDPERIATFWAWNQPKDKAGWMREKRQLGRQYVKDYISPRASISKLVDSFCRENFGNGKVIGAHIRGTDFSYAQPIGIDKYIQKIDSLLHASDEPELRVFVATDQQQYLEKMQEYYGDRLLYCDVTRSSNHLCPLMLEGVGGFQKGAEALIDVLILSRCEHIIKGPAGIGELATWFTTHNSITDFAIDSEFYTNAYSRQQSAYSAFNIDKKNAGQQLIQRFKEWAPKWIFSLRIGALFYKRFPWVRRLLKH